MRTLCYLLPLLVLIPGLAASQDASRGQIVAARWCANCHIVARSSVDGRADGLPTFPAVAADPSTTRGTLLRAMTAEHGRMPDFSLTAREQDDLIAYIFSLRQK